MSSEQQQGGTPEVVRPEAGGGVETWGKGLRYVERDVIVTKMYRPPPPFTVQLDLIPPLIYGRTTQPACTAKGIHVVFPCSSHPISPPLPPLGCQRLFLNP